MALIVPRLVATDLDGTLVRTDGTVSERSRAVLRELARRDVHVVLVTGRPFRRVRKLAAELQLQGVAICANGALLYDLESDAVLEHTQLSAEVAQTLIKDLRASLPEICFAVESGTGIGREPAYTVRRAIEEGIQSELAHAVLIGDAIELAACGASKLIARHPHLPIEELFAQASAIVQDRASITHAGSPFIEIAAAGVTKAWALAAHCAKLAIEPSQVVAFGDMPNDLPMLEWAGEGVAVANAHPSVLAAASAVTASNDEDGVAAHLERYLA